ncbi:helix-turn-helix domain-containing protein [Albimonas sp. CAU 1670]|uniref:winged helix-turn-helix transcriptional regulator n=1 Tax=Albimonas sp. CAU 1670 TaxID=3032599 RepID=UPI0023D9F822|nr:helix-turn-helix domain-containing protein [Albimonas sp. CAU 1670]MDF2233043.1 helix-turn-helix domain-containing protein [Albimonas sp. CAU 1670]
MSPEDLPHPPLEPGGDADAALSRAVEEIGDRWSLLIVWAAAGGTSRFDDFHRDLSVARNILSNRLRRLTDLGILEKRPVRDGARRMEYALTRKGAALRDVLDRLVRWGEVWTATAEVEK